MQQLADDLNCSEPHEPAFGLVVLLEESNNRIERIAKMQDEPNTEGG